MPTEECRIKYRCLNCRIEFWITRPQVFEYEDEYSWFTCESCDKVYYFPIYGNKMFECVETALMEIRGKNLTHEELWKGYLTVCDPCPCGGKLQELPDRCISCKSSRLKFLRMGRRYGWNPDSRWVTHHHWPRSMLVTVL